VYRARTRHAGDRQFQHAKNKNFFGTAHVLLMHVFGAALLNHFYNGEYHIEAKSIGIFCIETSFLDLSMMQDT
jgi:hypothetical protein